MSEKRKADAVVLISGADGTKTRYEIFKAEQFAERMAVVPFFHAGQPDLQINPADLETLNLVRVRVDGKWQPEGRRALYPMWRTCALIAQHIQNGIVGQGLE